GRGVEDVAPSTADQDVISGSADQDIVSWAPDQNIIAIAAVLGELDRAGGQPGSVHHVVAAQGIDDQAIVDRLGAGDGTPRGQPLDTAAPRVTAHQNQVVAAGAVDDDGIRLAVTNAAAGRARQIDVDLRHVGARQVVDGDRIGAAEGVDVDLLDAVEVHGDVADVPEEARPAAVGRQVHDL